MDQTIRIGRFDVNRNYLLFVIAMALLGVDAAVQSSSLTNRLVDELGITATQRGQLEFPRELPGLLGAFLLAAMASLGDIRSMALACFLAGAGTLAFGLIPSQYYLVIITMFLYSAGTHLTMPLVGSVTMTFAKEGQLGAQLGKIQGLNTAVVIIFTGFLYLMYQLFHMPVWGAFIMNSGALFLAGILLLMIKLPSSQVSRSKLVFRKEYSLYYLLSLINGARKQMTLTFVPLLLVEIFGKPVATITLLFFIVATLNVFFRPFLGKLIDRKGERFVLMGEAICLFGVSLGFAFSKTLFPGDVGFYVAAGCYILDNLLISVSMARTTYARKISRTASDISPTLAMGMSFDHLIATTIPAGLGLIWVAFGGQGYILVFILGSVISIMNVLCASRIRLPQSKELPFDQAEAAS